MPTVPTEPTTDLTIPQFAQAEGYPLDWTRKLLRGRSDLVQMLRSIGPTRVIPADRLDEFRAAIRAARG